MREIKFRAWRYDNSNPDLVPKMIYQVGQKSNGLSLFGQEFDKANTLVLMQYTGLKDKNGVEIYEGDILDAGDRIVQVKWHDLAGCWDTDWIKYKGEKTSNGLLNADWKYRSEIIGNIYENPELLK